MFQHPSVFPLLRRIRTAVTAGALAAVAIGPAVGLAGTPSAASAATVSASRPGAESAADPVSVPVPGTDDPALLASAGGPYTVVEGQPLQLDASASSGPDGDLLTYSWDLNGDGTFTDATGVSPTLSWSQLAALSINDGPATFQPEVRVSDQQTATVSSAATTLNVVNAAPVGFIGGSASAAGGLTATLVFSATDPSAIDQLAGFSYVVQWGDGTSDGPVHGPGALSKPHTYAAAGSYVVTLIATDKDGGVSASVTKTLTVTSQVTDLCETGKTLFVGGSTGDDVITVGPGTTAATVVVVVDGVTQNVPSGFVRLVIDAGAGNDTVTVSGLVTVPRILYGGTGNDTLTGGDGSSVLVGGDGNDVLTGGGAPDVMIGGAGSDKELGAAGDDLLIGGSTAWDAPTTSNQGALCGIQAEWDRTDVSFALRVLHLLGLGKGSLSYVHFVLTGRNSNVFAAPGRDALEGDSGWNWCLCTLRDLEGRGLLRHGHELLTSL